MKFILYISEYLVPIIIFYIAGFAFLSKRPVFDDFIEGAKQGMKTVAEILPTLIGLMTAVGVLRASGFLDFLSGLLEKPASLFHIPAQIVPAWYPARRQPVFCWIYSKPPARIPMSG